MSQQKPSLGLGKFRRTKFSLNSLRASSNQYICKILSYELFRAFTVVELKIQLFGITKSCFIYFTYSLYKTSSISGFILNFNIIKQYKHYNKILYLLHYFINFFLSLYLCACHASPLSTFTSHFSFLFSPLSTLTSLYLVIALSFPPITIPKPSSLAPETKSSKLSRILWVVGCASAGLQVVPWQWVCDL